MIYEQDNKLCFRFDDHRLWLEPWGPNALRIRATKLASFPPEDWALSEKPIDVSDQVTINISKEEGTIVNGKIKATVSRRGKVIVYDSLGKKILEVSKYRAILPIDRQTAAKLHLGRSMLDIGLISRTRNVVPSRSKHESLRVSLAATSMPHCGWNPWTLMRRCTVWDLTSNRT